MLKIDFNCCFEYAIPGDMSQIEYNEMEEYLTLHDVDMKSTSKMIFQTNTDAVVQQPPPPNSCQPKSEATTSTGCPTKPKRRNRVTKIWTQETMDSALDALRSHSMNVSTASTTFDIPYQTLWKYAKQSQILASKHNKHKNKMQDALDAVRSKTQSIPQVAAKFGVPYSTLWQEVNNLKIERPQIRAARKKREPKVRKFKLRPQPYNVELKFTPGANAFR